MKRLFPVLTAMLLVSMVMAAALRADHLYVVDADAGTVGLYSSTGAAIDPNLISGLPTPWAIALSGSDLFISSLGNDPIGTGTISLYSTSGNLLNPNLISGLSAPTGIAISGSYLYVTNYSTGTVGQYTTSGAVVNPSLITGLDSPYGIVATGTDLYVVDNAKGTIGEYDLSGNVVNASLITGLADPWGIAISGSNLYVSEVGKSRVSQYTTSGTTVNAWLAPASFAPGIAATATSLYICDYGQNAVNRYSTSGEKIKTPLISGLSGPVNLAIETTPPSAPGPSIFTINPATDISGNPGPGQFWGFKEGHGDGMVGWCFTLKQAAIISHVGWYDEGQDGLSRDFQVGLWDANSNQLLGTPSAGVTIPAGTATQLDGNWRVVDLEIPLELAPGDYILGGVDTASTTDTIMYASSIHAQSLMDNSLLSVGAFFYAAMDSTGQTGLHKPETFYAANGLELGPMLFTRAVPEPASLLWMAAGAMALLVRGCRPWGHGAR